MSQGEDLSSNAGEFVASSEETRTLTRADLAEALHKRAGFGRADSAKYVEMVLDEIFTSIVTRNDVKLSSFGAFLVRAKRERQGRNPKTGKEARITARLVVTFKPSNVLRDRINGGDGDGADDE
jgi:integration host factor subunit alpha